MKLKPDTQSYAILGTYNGRIPDGEHKPIMVRPRHVDGIAIGRTFSNYGRPAVIAVYDIVEAEQVGEQLPYNWYILKIGGVTAYFSGKEIEILEAEPKVTPKKKRTKKAAP